MEDLGVGQFTPVTHRHARVEHALGAMVQQGGKFLRTIGMARVEVKIGMMDLVCNMRRGVVSLRPKPQVLYYSEVFCSSLIRK